MGLARCRCLSIEPPERCVQDDGETDPGDVGKQAECGDARHPAEGDDRRQNRRPEQNDVDEGSADPVPAEEQGRPQRVEDKLQHKEPQSDPHRAAAGAPPPHEERRDAHQNVQHRPDRPKNPAWRIEPGLVQPGVPLVQVPPADERDPEPPGGEATPHANHQLDQILAHRLHYTSEMECVPLIRA